MPAQRGTAGAAVASASNVANPTTLNPPLPAHQAGDVLLCYTACRATVPTVATPAGWTQLFNVTGTNGRLALFGKVAASSSESAPAVTWSGLTTGTGGTPVQAQCAVFMETMLSTDVLGTVENAAGSTTTAAGGAALTTLTANDLVLSCSFRPDDVGTWTPPAGNTMIGSALTTSGADMAVAWSFHVRAAPGSAATGDYGLAGAVNQASTAIQIALKGTTVLGSSLAVPYGVVSALGASCALPYDVDNAVGSSLGLPYAVQEEAALTAVGASSALPYSLLSVVGGSRAFPYGVAGIVGSSRALPFAVTTVIASSRALPFNVFVAVGGSRALVYTVTVLVGGSRATPYQVRTALGASRALPHGITSLAGHSLALPFEMLPPEWSPAAISGLGVWLDASQLGLTDGDPVSTWSDLSGGGRDFTGSGAARPLHRTGVANGLPVVRFDGTDDKLIAAAPFACRHLFVMARHSAATFPDYDGLLSGAPTGGGDVVLVGHQGSARFYSGGPPSISAYHLNGVSHPVANMPAPMNGVWGAISVAFTANGNPQQIGVDRYLDTRHWEGDVAEVLTYDRVLSDAERQQVESYLRDKWVVGTAGASLALPYSVASQVGASRSLPFALTTLAGDSRVLPYATRALAATSRSLPYTLRTTLGASRALPYALTTTLGSSRSLPYALRTAIGGSRSLLYVVAGGIGVSRALPYGVRSVIGASRTLSYGVSFTLGLSRSLPYQARTLVGASRSLIYTVNGGVAAVLAFPYEVTLLVGASSAQPFAVLTFMGESLRFAYHVEQAPFIGFSLVMPWKVHLLLAQPLEAAAVARVTHVRAAERVTTVRAVPPTGVQAILREDAVKPDKRKLELVT